VPLTGYLNVHSGNKKAGFYMSFIFVILGAVILFFMDFWKKGIINMTETTIVKSGR